LDFVGVRSGLGQRDAVKAARGRGLHLAIATALAVLSVSALASTAVAAPSPAIPDPVAPGVPGNGRAWELVTPGEVIGARVSAVSAIGLPLLVGVSDSGGRVVYRTLANQSDASFGGLFNTGLAVRGMGGWTNTQLEGPDPGVVNPINNEGLSAFNPDFSESLWTNPIRNASAPNVGLYARHPDGAFELLTTLENSYNFTGASRDLSRAWFTSAGHLLPGDAARTEGTSVYELDGSALRQVDVKDDGGLVSNCGASFARASRDGTRVFFGANPGCGPNSHVFLRAGGHTTDISASRCTLADCGPEASVSLVSITPDGSFAFLYTAQRLTDEDSDELADFYRYDVAGGRLELLYTRSPGSSGTPISTVRSADGSRSFFLSSGPLTPDGSPEQAELDVVDDQGLRFISASADDFQVSLDGRYAFFPTASRLTATDSDESIDVYRYDAVTDSYLELSAGPEGRGNGPFAVTITNGIGKTSTGGPTVGRSVFFETVEQLLPQDGNDKTDVYEWTEAGGLGLISAGTPGFSAQYLGSSRDDSTALFVTNATLLPSDRDGGEQDVYAARIGGGFTESSDATGCGEGACDEAPSLPALRRGPAAGTAPSFFIARLDAAARRQIVAKGWTTLLAEVPVAGQLSAEGRAEIDARKAIVATGTATAKDAGPVRLRLRLSAAARRSLARGQELRVHLTLHLSSSTATRRAAFALRPAG
jgi:hypothetical protein